MLKSPLLLAVSVLVALFSWTGTARAVEGLNFELPPSALVTAAVAKKVVPVNVAVMSSAADKTSLESRPVAEVPVAEVMARPAETLPPLVENAAASEPEVEPSDIGVQFLENSIELPSQATEERTADLTGSFGFLSQQPAAKEQVPEQIDRIGAEPDGLDLTYGAISLDDWIFEGGSRSLVAHTVGSAEGTRHWSGKKTKAYYGHEDPGNGVWNLGTFSYQHEASSPEDADERQLKRLKYQGIQLEELAQKEGVELSLFEKLNGLDLANQAPIAALGKGGYIERLAQARRLALASEDAIVWARTRAYLDPDTRAWNAPGLGNNLHSISRDQERRMSAISKALQAYSPTGEQTLALSNLEAISLEKFDLSASRFEGGSVNNADDIGIGFELSDGDIRQSMADADSVLNETALEEVGIEQTLPDEALDIAVLDVGTVDEQLLPTSTEVTAYAADLDAAAEVAFPQPSEASSEVALEVVRTEDDIAADDIAVNDIAASEPEVADAPEAVDVSVAEVEAIGEDSGLSFASSDSLKVDLQDLQAGVLRDSPEQSLVERTPVLPLLSEQEVTEPVVSASIESATQPVDASPELPEEVAAQLETEIAIPAPLKREAARGDRPSPNRSWWRTEDKVVRKQ